MLFNIIVCSWISFAIHSVIFYIHININLKIISICNFKWFAWWCHYSHFSWECDRLILKCLVFPKINWNCCFFTFGILCEIFFFQLFLYLAYHIYCMLPTKQYQSFVLNSVEVCKTLAIHQKFQQVKNFNKPSIWHIYIDYAFKNCLTDISHYTVFVTLLFFHIQHSILFPNLPAQGHLSCRLS